MTVIHQPPEVYQCERMTSCTGAEGHTDTSDVCRTLIVPVLWSLCLYHSH